MPCRGDKPYDVAIVGGGVAGCYCAYRLARADPTQRIVLIESELRLGGRLETKFFPNVSTPVELGGAFVTDLHPRTCTLLRELDLELTPVTWSRRFFFIRGRRFTDRDCKEAPDSIPYGLAASERGRTPVEILLEALNKILPGVDELWPMNRQGSPEEVERRLRETRVEGRVLDDWEIGALLRRVMSGEAHRALMETFGAASNFQGASAYDAMRTLMGELAPQRAFVVKQGFQRLPEELASRSGVEVRAGARLEAVAAARDGVSLGLGDGDRISAKRVVLALPRVAIEIIRFEASPEALRAFRAMLNKVRAVPAFKLYMTFDRMWWPEIQSETAASFTDLPMQQCYYFDAPSGSAALLLAVFADDERALDWQARHAAGEAVAVSPELVESAMQQLRIMHPDEFIPEPIGAKARAWPGAWHAWRPGAQSWRRANAVLGPHLDLPLYVCGEAYSDRQGWVEGAVESTSHMLRLYFKLDDN
jgi:monoamine oxidase